MFFIIFSLSLILALILLALWLPRQHVDYPKTWDSLKLNRKNLNPVSPEYIEVFNDFMEKSKNKKFIVKKVKHFEINSQ